MEHLKDLIIHILEEQNDEPDTNNLMCAEEILHAIKEKHAIDITLSDVQDTLNEMVDIRCENSYYYCSSIYLMDVDYEEPFCECKPSYKVENQIQGWNEYEVCINCNRPIKGSCIPIGDE